MQQSKDTECQIGLKTKENEKSCNSLILGWAREKR